MCARARRFPQDKALHTSLVAASVLEEGPQADGEPSLDERRAADLAALQAIRLLLEVSLSLFPWAGIYGLSGLCVIF